MNGAAFGQYIPHKSVIHLLDPRTKLYLVAVMMVVVFAVDSWVGVLTMAAYAVVMRYLSGIPWRVFVQGMKPLMVLMAVTVVFQLLLVPGKAVFEWWLITVTDAGIRMGGLMGFRLTMVFFLAQLLTITTSPLQLTDALEKLLGPFRRIGVPAHELAMIMTIALRFIPVFFEETDKIFRAQMSRGADFSGSLKNIRNLVSIMVPVFTRAFRRADELAMAMESRCYVGGDGRTRLHELTMRGRDRAAIVLITILAALTFLGI